jgi:muramoyltetrapeptide carboxypeptidase
MTALFNGWLRHRGKVCLYGPVVTELAGDATYDRRSLNDLLKGNSVTFRFRPGQVIASGKGSGRLLGGNLSVLATMLGTRYMPDYDGAVLALEDTAEETYRLDRLLTHLRMSGVLRRLAAVCLGSFDPPPTARDFPPDRDLNDLLDETFGPLGVPVVTGMPFGHRRRKRSLPLGGRAVLDTSRGSLEISATAEP